MLKLAVVLTPERIADAAQWRQWLLALVQSGVPANVRFTVTDRADAPALDELHRDEPKRVVTTAPELDMPGAVRELIRDAGVSGPGAAFQRHFIGLSEAATKGNLPRAKHLAEAALSIATEHNWLPLQVTVHMALGGAYLAAGKTAEALAVYQNAGKAADAAKGQGDASGTKLLIQSRLAEGATLVSGGRYAEAATVYERTAPLATEAKDTLMTLESWRMAAYCHEAARQHDSAWKCGCNALDAGAGLDDKLRPNSTLPYVGQGLLRLTSQRAYADKAKEVRQRMVGLVGPDWEKKIEQMEKSVS
jgi:tetratricopeptide (TPR) repeat protein